MVKKVSKIPKGKIKPFLTSQREKLEDQRQKKLNPENIKELPKEKPEIKLSKVQMMMQRISIGFDTPDEIMAVIQEVFSETEPYPRPGNIYTFVYTAKTPGILYDQHPLSIIDSILYLDLGDIMFIGRSSEIMSGKELRVHSIL